MGEYVYTGKKLTKRQRERRAESEMTCYDHKVQFAWGRISREPESLAKGRKGLSKWGLKPKTFIKTIEYLMIADRIYKKHAEFMMTRCFFEDKKTAKEFGIVMLGSVFYNLEDV